MRARTNRSGKTALLIADAGDARLAIDTDPTGRHGVRKPPRNGTAIKLEFLLDDTAGNAAPTTELARPIHVSGRLTKRSHSVNALAANQSG